MQVTGTSSGQQYNSTPRTTEQNRKTDEYLFEENNRQQAQTVAIQAQIANPSETSVAPSLIGALLSSFADEVINFLGGDVPEVPETDENENNPDERVTPTAGTTNYVA